MPFAPLLLAFLLLASAAFGATAPIPPVTLTFWNIEWFPGNRPNANPDEQSRHVDIIQRETAKITTDILGLMEVRDEAAANVAIAKMPGFKVDVCSNFPAGTSPGTQQVVIASRLPAIGAWAEPWKVAGPVQPPRGFAFAAYQIAPQKVLLVYAVHLKSNRGEADEDIAMREESGRQLYSHMVAMVQAYSKMGAVDIVAGGDFNTSLDDPRYTKEKTLRALQGHGFEWIWKNKKPETHVTMPGDGRFPPACFDQIFFHGGTLLKASVYQTPAEASDHRAVTATIAP